MIWPYYISSAEEGTVLQHKCITLEYKKDNIGLALTVSVNYMQWLNCKIKSGRVPSLPFLFPSPLLPSLPFLFDLLFSCPLFFLPLFALPSPILFSPPCPFLSLSPLLFPYTYVLLLPPKSSIGYWGSTVSFPPCPEQNARGHERTMVYFKLKNSVHMTSVPLHVHFLLFPT